MKEALFYKTLKNKLVKCELCPNFCVIAEGKLGKCKVRKNVDGQLYSLVYARPCSIAIDPIEKKPLYHFLPGSKTLSIATFGCNLACLHCQNYEISQEFMEKEINALALVDPEKIVDKAKELSINIISYTYTEPTIFYEYMFDIARIARKQGLRNVIISNGYINEKPLRKLLRFIDAANIDLKALSNKFYLEICKAKIEPILNTIKIIAKSKTWLEITNLIIPGLNDDKAEITRLIHFIYSLSKDIPLHFTAFYPAYKLSDIMPTPAEAIIKAREKALAEGLRYVYAGNIANIETNSTYCYSCDTLLIKRRGFNIIQNNLVDGKCPKCNIKIAGIWQ